MTACEIDILASRQSHSRDSQRQAERQNVLARAKGQQLVCQSDVAVRHAPGSCWHLCQLHLGPLTGKHVGAAGRSLTRRGRRTGGQSTIVL